MKTLLSLLATALLSMAFAHAQVATYNLPFQHIIVVVQENRTPTNLFGNDSALVANGFHLAANGLCGTQSVTFTSYQLDACFDASHAHTAWETAYNSGAMNGFCQIPSGISSCTTQQQMGIPTCTVNGTATLCPQYTTVNA